MGKSSGNDQLISTSGVSALNPTESAVRSAPRSDLVRRVVKNRGYYALIIPTIVFFIIFHYIPYYGLTLAFKDFQIFKGIGESPWVGLEHFRAFFNSPDFYRLVRNTVRISVLRLVFEFPVPIIFALLLNEVTHSFYKRAIQTVSYFPHFLSWVVFGGIVFTFVRPSGVINDLVRSWGGETIPFLTDGNHFLAMLISTSMLKNFGFAAIVYLAALSGIDPQLYEAAVVDGAGKWRQIFHITLPGIKGTVVVLFILNLGNIMNAGFDQVFIMYNASVFEAADIIDTFVYRIGLQGAQYSLGTVVGVFKGLIGFVLIVVANYIVRRSGEYSIW